MNIAAIDPSTFTSLLAYVGAAAILAVSAVLGIQAAIWAPKLVMRFLRHVNSAGTMKLEDMSPYEMDLHLRSGRAETSWKSRMMR